VFKSAWFIAKKDVTYSLRQKETLIWIFIMPIVFFYFIGKVTGGALGPPRSGDRPDSLTLLEPESGGFLVDELVSRLEQENFKVTRTTDEQVLKDAGRRLRLPAAPEGHATFTAGVLAGQQAILRFGTNSEGPTANLDEVRVARAVYTVLADVVVTAESGKVVGREAFDELGAMTRTINLEVKPAGERLEIPTGYSQTIPGTLVMFTMLVLLTGGAILLVIEREQGLLRRLAVTPISRSSVVLGKWMGKFGLGLVQIAVAVLMGTYLFELDWGNSLPMVGVVLFTWAAFTASLGILLANIARNEAQMSGIGVLVTMLMAALGGCWWPIEITPSWMQDLALCLPTGWAMDAMHKLINFGYGPLSALPNVAAIVTGTLILGWLGVRTFRYQ